MENGQFALKFISGRYVGGEFPLPLKGEVIIGRSSDLGMVLVEEMVSRRHSRIVVDGPRIGIMDLGSTNGTFVNGEKVAKRELKINDRILVGTSILKVVSSTDLSDKASHMEDKELRDMLEELARIHGSESTMTGELEEVPLPDLLQLFSSSKKSGALVISGDNQGSIILKEGQLMDAQITQVSLPPKKAFVRMVQWRSGQFEMRALSDVNYPQRIDEGTESLLIEAMRQADEMARIAADMPRFDACLIMSRPILRRLRDCTPEQLDIVQLVIGASSFQQALDDYPGFDFDVYKPLRDVMKLGIIRAA